MRYLTVLLLAVVYIAPDAHAQQGSYGVNLGFGLAKALGEGSEDMSLGPSLIGGVSYGLNDNVRASIEASYTDVFTNDTIPITAGTAIVGLTAGVKASTSTDPFSFHLQGGGGFARVKAYVDFANIEAVENGGMMFVEGGARISFTEVFGLMLVVGYNRTIGVGEEAFQWMPVRLNLVFNRR
ncbi:MAG: outer membrane beta-barrel protein [Gemmatimonadetes bacterium]|nr:outer membrane beta-barrel protein [Gemmatimonadota bacterium]